STSTRFMPNPEAAMNAVEHALALVDHFRQENAQHRKDLDEYDAQFKALIDLLKPEPECVNGTAVAVVVAKVVRRLKMQLLLAEQNVATASATGGAYRIAEADVQDAPS